MIKKIDIMGIGLDNYTVRESMRQVENYLSNDVLNTIENISMQMLIASETDPVLHNVISELDLSVIGEKEILKAADADSMQRVQETEQNDFSYEFYRRIERNKRSIFVLGQTEEDVQKVKAELQEAFPKLILAGEYAQRHPESLKMLLPVRKDQKQECGKMMQTFLCPVLSGKKLDLDHQQKL